MSTKHKVWRITVQKNVVKVHKLCCHHCSTSNMKIKKAKSRKRINNYRATEILKSLHRRKQSFYFDAIQHNQKIVTKAIEIYNKIDEEKNDFAVNSFLKICLQFQHQHQIFSIWNDIKTINGISFPLIIECCIKSMHIDKANSSIPILKDIENSVNINDIITKTALINAYSHANEHDHALQIFDSIDESFKDKICVSTMIKCLIQNNSNELALQMYAKYDRFHDDILHLLALKACKNLHSFAKGKEIHSSIISMNKNKDHSIELFANLIDFYGYFGEIDTAQMIFNSIAKNKVNVQCIGSLMKWFIHNHANEQALILYKQCSFHNDITHLLALKACIHLHDKSSGDIIIQQHELFNNRNNHSVEVRNILIQFYAHFGDIDRALHIFNDIENKNIVVINCMLQGLVNNSRNNEALSIYTRFENKYVFDDTTYLFSIKACHNIGDIAQCHNIITQHVALRSNSHSIELLNGIISFYGSISDIAAARNVYNSINENKRNNTSTINSMMQAYILNELYANALEIYGDNLLLIDNISNVFALKACINTDDKAMGQQIIADSNLRDIERSVEVENCMINFYGHFNDIQTANYIFNEITNKNAVSINCLMQALILNNCHSDAVCIYDEYQELQDDISHIYALNVYSVLRDFAKGKEIHLKQVETAKKQSIEYKNTLIDFYGTFGYIQESKTLFDDIKEEEKTVVTINCMMSSFCDNKYYPEVLTVYDEYEELINDVSHLLAIKACKHMHNFDKGNKIYNTVKNKAMRCELESSFIDFYASFGDIDMAVNIFNSVENKNDISLWNALLHCYGRNGDMINAKKIYDEILQKEEISADITTYCTFLNGCSHCGQVKMAEFVWENHIRNEDMKYNKYVMTAFIDCFSRNGHLEKAYELVNDYSFDANNREMWFALLSGCRNHENNVLAKKVHYEMKQRFGAGIYMTHNPDLLLTKKVSVE